MFREKSRRLGLVAGVLALLLLSCVIEEDLRINGDGSGSYRIKLTMPKELGAFDELRKSVEKDGYQVEQEGETEKERFIVFSKTFTDVSALNDSHNEFELTIADSGFMRREYRLRARLRGVDFGSYKRRIVFSMPGKVQSATAGEIAGGRVTWEGSYGGALEIVSSGFYLPVNSTLSLGVLALGLLLFAAMRRRRGTAHAAALCPSCNSPFSGNARFCRVCGASAPMTEA